MSIRLVSGPLSRQEKLRVAYSAWARGDASVMFSIVTDDCEFTLVGNPAVNPHAGTRVGIEGLKVAMAEFHTDFVIRDIVIETIVLVGDHAAINWHGTFEIKRTHRIHESERLDLLEFRGDLICRARCFYDSATMALMTGRATLRMPADLPSG
ncbi:nuclear transport factor 2 family protein [Phreatobacter sp.]|uniref:nuclear transport factor 2 family protein n=1 Tax=Phreatobacter sp. TaxID=1966341 RepID=UPI003F6FBDBD